MSGTLCYLCVGPLNRSVRRTRDRLPWACGHVAKGRMKGIAIVAGSIVAFAPTAAPGRSEACNAAIKQPIAALFDRWYGSLETGGRRRSPPETTRSRSCCRRCRTRRAPTRAPRRRLQALRREPSGRQIDSRTAQIDCNTAVGAGPCTFTLGNGTQAEATHTYTYKRDGKTWLIGSHARPRSPRIRRRSRSIRQNPQRQLSTEDEPCVSTPVENSTVLAAENCTP